MQFCAPVDLARSVWTNLFGETYGKKYRAVRTDGRTDRGVDELVVGWHCRRRWKASSLDPTAIPLPSLVYDALQSLTVKLVDEFPADHCGL